MSACTANTAPRRECPYKDFAGATVFEGDTLIHPDLDEFTCVYEARHDPDGNLCEHRSWRAVYVSDGTNLPLWMQVNGKGQAVRKPVVRADVL